MLEPLTTASSKSPWTHHSSTDVITAHWCKPAVLKGAGRRVVNKTDVRSLSSQVIAIKWVREGCDRKMTFMSLTEDLNSDDLSQVGEERYTGPKQTKHFVQWRDNMIGSSLYEFMGQKLLWTRAGVQQGAGNLS